MQVSLNTGEGSLLESLKCTYGLRIRGDDFAAKHNRRKELCFKKELLQLDEVHPREGHASPAPR